jgi:threonine/homoserine/homoserine lactone efflux protein
MKKSVKNEQSFGRKAAIYVVVGIMTFTMIFSVFAGLVAAIN